MKKSKHTIKKMVLSSMFLALAIALPFLTGQIPQIGKSLCPMHIPVILCGYICGPIYALIVGFISPLFRSFLFGMPKIFPDGAVMCFELAAYGFISGILYRKLPAKKINIYISLIAAMLGGRVVWGVVKAFILGITGSEFGIKMFIMGGFVNAFPGIILQIVVIPLIVIALEKNNKQQ